MRQSPPFPADDLKEGLQRLLCEQAAALLAVDWHDPEAVALTEKRGRIIQVHRGNVEKTLGMNDHENNKANPDDPFDGDTEALKRELERRLLRHAERLGREELVRRLRARGIAPPTVGMEFLGETGSEGSGR